MVKRASTRGRDRPSEAEVAEVFRLLYAHVQSGLPEEAFDCPAWLDYDEGVSFIAECAREEFYKKLLSNDAPIVLIFDAHIDPEGVTRFLIYFRTCAVTGNRAKCEFIDVVEFTHPSASALFENLLVRVSKYGLTLEMLKQRVIGYEFEGASVLEALAEVLKDRIKSDLLIRPYMNSHIGRYMMKVFSTTELKNIFSSLKQQLLKDQAARTSDFGKQLLARIAELNDPDFLEHEHWVYELCKTLDCLSSCCGEDFFALITDMLYLLTPLVTLRENIRSDQVPEHANWKICKTELAKVAQDSRLKLGGMNAAEIVEILLDHLACRFRSSDPQVDRVLDGFGDFSQFRT